MPSWRTSASTGSSRYRDGVNGELTRQGTVWSYDDQTQSGTVVTDDGTELTFSADAFRTSGLRLLRPGQRVRMAVADHIISTLTIVTLDEPR